MLNLYNTLTRQKEEFKTIKPNHVLMYTCGPTVYDNAHIGNLTLYLFSDLLKKYLRFREYKVNDAMNLTDVDDKTIRNSQKNNIPLKEYTRKYEKEFLKDLKTIGIEKPKHLIRATDNIKVMIKLVEKLIEKGYAYQAPDKSVYFSIAKFPTYGELANLQKQSIQTGASGRVTDDEYEKDNAADFVLWKAWSETDGPVKWNSPWGEGRPGWHLECSAMVIKHLAETIDIHIGGEDLIFPHHQNEIAQSEAATGKKFVNYWLHRAFLKVDNQKMSKSLNNFYTLKDILTKHPDSMAFRYLIATTHYKTPFNFTIEGLKSAATALSKIREFRNKMAFVFSEDDSVETTLGLIEAARQKFTESMDDDLNTPQAIASLFELMNQVNELDQEKKLGEESSRLILKYLKSIDKVWGFIFTDFEPSREFKKQVEELIARRNLARQEKDFATADSLRDQIADLGVKIKDEGDGTSWNI